MKGNASTVLSSNIELTPDPIRAKSRSTSNDANGAFSNDTRVQMQLNGINGGTRIAYRLYNSFRNCPGLNGLTKEETLTPSLTVDFGSEGQKTACAAIIDDAGNASAIRKANITIDITAPTEPTLSPDNLSG